MSQQNLRESENDEAQAETVEAQPVEPEVEPEGEPSAAAEEVPAEDVGEPAQAELVGGIPPNDPLAIASLACGIAGIVLGWCCNLIGLPLSIAAIVMGIIAMNRIGAHPDQYRGKGMALAGTIIGAAALILAILFIVFGIGMAIMTEA